MPILGTEVIPAGPGYALLDQKNQRGGYRSVPDHATRDALAADFLVLGMWIKTLNDGLVWELTTLSPAAWTQVPFSAGVVPVIYWGSQTGDQLYTQILTLPGQAAIVLCPTDTPKTFPAGVYDFTNVLFKGVGGFRGNVTFAAGATVDGGSGSYIELAFEDCVFQASAPLVTPGTTKPLFLRLTRAWCMASNSSPLFSLSTANSIIIMQQSQLGKQSSGSLFDLAGGARLSVQCTGGGYDPQLPPIATAGTFTGTAGCNIAVLCDALSSFDIRAGIAAPLTVEIVSIANGRLGLPNYATTDLPTPSAFRLGQVAWDLTAETARVANASKWPALATSMIWWTTQAWSVIYEQIQAAAGPAIVYVVAGLSYEVPAGAYDLSQVTFTRSDAASSSAAFIQFDAGVLLDAGAVVGLSLDGVLIFASAALMTPMAAKNVVVRARHGGTLISSGSGTFTLFDTTGTSSLVELFEGAIRNNNGPTFNLGASSFLNYVAYGGLCSWNIGAAPPGGHVVSGASGASVTLTLDALTRAKFDPAFVGSPVTVALSAFPDVLALPPLATGSLPTPTAGNAGQLAYDTTTGLAKQSNGTAWPELSTTAITWRIGETWTSVYARIQALGGSAIVYLPASQEMTAGSYDLSNVLFIGEDNSGFDTLAIVADAGVLLDAGPVVGLNLRGINFDVQGALMTPSANKRVMLNLFNSSLIGATAATWFDSTFQNGNAGHEFYFQNGRAHNSSGMLLFMRNASAVLALNMFGGISSPTSGPTQYDGLGGANIQIINDALSEKYVQSDVIAVGLGREYKFPGYLMLPSYPTLAAASNPAPTPSANNIGEVFWNTTNHRPEVSTGVVNAPLNTGSGAVFVWTSGKTWTTLWAEIQANGSAGTVYIPAHSTVTIDGAGPYDLSQVFFIGLGDRSVLLFAVGALIDGGSVVVFNAKNLIVLGQAPLMTAGSKDIRLNLEFVYFESSSSGAPLFTTSSTNNVFYLTRSTLQNGLGNSTDSIIFLNGSGHGGLFVVAQGGGWTTQHPILEGVNAIQGASGADITMMLDSCSAYLPAGAIASPVTVNGANTPKRFGRLTLPTYAATDILAAAATTTGQAWFNTDTAQPEVSNGAVNKPLVGFIGTATKTGTYTAGYFETVYYDSTGGAFAINLPTAVGRNGYQIKFKNKGGSATAVTLTPTGSEKIDGASTLAMTGTTGVAGCTKIESDGAGWNVVT